MKNWKWLGLTASALVLVLSACDGSKKTEDGNDGQGQDGISEDSHLGEDSQGEGDGAEALEDVNQGDAEEDAEDKSDAGELPEEGPCESDCDTLSCGDMDRCGKICGCPLGEGCIEKTCQAAGDSCDSPIPVLLEETGHWHIKGDLRNRSNHVEDYATTLGCPQIGAASTGARPDEVFSFVPPVTTVYHITLSGEDPNSDMMFAVFEGPGCGEGQCLGLVDNNPTPSSDDASFELEKGKTYLIVVDSFSDEHIGAFSLNIEGECAKTCEPGSCQVDDGCGGLCRCTAPEVCLAESNTCYALPGDTCDLAFEVTGVSVDSAFEMTEDLCPHLHSYTAENTAGGCKIAAGTTAREARDFALKFTPPEDGNYHLVVSQPKDLQVNVIEGTCPQGSYDQCIASSDVARISGPESLNLLNLKADKDYYIVVTEYSRGVCEGEDLPVEISIKQHPKTESSCDDRIDNDFDGLTDCDDPDCAEFPACIPVPGDSCEDPLPLLGDINDTAVATGNLERADASITQIGACVSLGVTTGTESSALAKSDLVFSFESDEAGSYEITVSPHAEEDLAWILLSGSSCTGNGMGCGGYMNGGGQGEVESYQLNLNANTQYFLLVKHVGGEFHDFEVSVSAKETGGPIDPEEDVVDEDDVTDGEEDVVQGDDELLLWESFDARPDLGGSSYGTMEFKSAEGNLDWNCFVVRVESPGNDDYSIDGPGILMKDSTSYCDLALGGAYELGAISLEVRKAYTGNGNRMLKIYADGNLILSEELLFAPQRDDTVQTLRLENLSPTLNPSVLSIHNSGAQIVIDNLKLLGNP